MVRPLRFALVVAAVGGLGALIWQVSQKSPVTPPSSPPAARTIPATALTPAAVAPLAGPSATPLPRPPAPARRPATATAVVHHHPAPTGTAGADFFDWLDRYFAAAPAERASLLAEGRRLASARRVELKGIITLDPLRALREAVPMTLRQQLPPEIVELLEERVNERATLRVYQGAPDPTQPLPTGSLTHRIAEFSADRAYIANVYGRRAQSVITTRHDSVNGIAIDNQFAVSEEPARELEAGEIPNPAKTVTASCPISGIEVVSPEAAAEPIPPDTTVLETPEEIIYLCGGYHKTTYYDTYLYAEGSTGGPTPLTGILPAAPTPSLGVAKILYIPMTFADQNSVPATESKCYEVMRDVADYYAKSSYGRLTTMSTVTPPIKLPHNEAWYVQKDTSNGGTVDGLSLELAHAREEAKKLGFDWNDYDCTVMRLNGGPRVVGGWGGVGNVWIYSDSVVVTAHEIGHSFALSHANFWDTAGTSAIGGGTNAEYGDIFDVMGGGGVPTDQYNAQAKNQIKWLPNDYVTDITQSGLYRVHAFDQPVLDPANRYAIKIVKDSQRTYWGEVRQLYNGNATRPWADKGLILGWRFPNGGATNIQLIDTTPGSPFAKDDSAISLGRTFSDFESGIHITTVAVSTTTPKYVDVVVNMGQYPGNHAPTLSLAASAEVVPQNTTVTFTATAADADGDALAYSWQNFGDSSVRIVSPNSPSITRTFSTAGTYVVTCTVSDMKGGTSIRSKLITVGNGGGKFAISGRITALGLGVPNVIVNANGANSVITDSDGYYIIPNLTTTTYSMTALLYGYSFSEIFNNNVTVGPNFSGADFVADASPLVGITATVPVASETGPASGQFTITRTGDISQPLTVNVNAASGTAVKTTDYSFSTDYVAATQGFSTFTIPADQASLVILVTPVDDAAAEGPETVILQLGPGTGYVVSAAASATVTIDDNDTVLPKVRVEATTARVIENSGQPAVLTFTRTGATTGDLVVNYTIGGTASAVTDYTALSGTVTIPSGSASAAVNIVALNDAISEPVKTVVVTMTAGAAYLVDPAASTATATISDDDIQIVSLTASDPTATEVDLSVPGAQPDTGTFLISRTGDTTQPLTIYYAVAGQATGTPAIHGVDYDALPGVLTIPAGSTTASVTITPRWDNLGEGPETVTLHLGGGSTNYQISPSASNAVVTINDGGNPAYLEVIAMTSAAEPSTSGVFRLSARGSGTGTLTVNYTISGTATAGSDYTIAGLDTVNLTGTTTIQLNNGTVTKDLAVVPVNDGLAEDLENITLTLTSDAAYTSYGPTSAATMWLRDDDQPTVYVDPHVTTYPPSVGEAGPAAAFYLSRTGSTASSLVVNFTMSGTATAGSDYIVASNSATIPAGALGVDVTISPIDDAVFEGTETIIMTLASGAYGRGPAATLYLTDNESSTQKVAFAAASGSGLESASPVNIPVTLTSAATAPVTVEYAIDSGARSTTTTAAAAVTPTLTLPYWVRVVRTGTTFRSYVSTDGAAWAQHGSTQTIDISASSYLAGIMMTGGVPGLTGTLATVDNVSITDLSAGGSVGGLFNSVVGTPNPTGSASVSSGTYTLSAGGPDVSSGTTDACRYLNFPITNSANCTITARIVSITGSAVSISAGAMIRESTANNARHFTTNALQNNSLRETYRSVAGLNGVTVLSTKPSWIRLQRAGNVFSAFYSVNGTAWLQAGTNQTIALSTEVLAGLAVTARSDGTLSTATYDNISLTPGPLPSLQGRTVGFVDAQGSDSAAAGIQTVIGSGAGIGSTQDECHFLAAPVTGDFTLTARVLSQAGGASNAQAGVMIRENAGYRSRMLYLGSVANSNLEFLTRASTVTNSFGTGIDYTLASGKLTFNIGDTTQNIVLNVANDSLPEPDEELSFVLRNSYGAQLGTQTTFIYTVIDDDAPSVLPSLGFASAASTVAETAGTIAIPVSLGVPSTSSVTVNYAITAGTAIAGSDFTASAGTLTIPAGETVGYISVGILDDTLVEVAETVLITLTTPAGARLSNSSVHTLTIADNEFPVVSVTATDPDANEAGDPGTFTFTRVGSISGALSVAFTRTGTASSGVDFQAIVTPGTVTIPDGQSSATVTVTPVQDTTNEGNETVILTISASAAYTIGTPTNATVTIADDDRSTVTIAATDPSASETPGDTGQFTITRTAPITGALTVNVTITGTATNTTDYATIAATVSFTAGQASRTITVTPVDDAITEGPEEVTVQLASGSYTIGTDSYANVTIADNDSPPTLFISGPTAQGCLIATGNGLIVSANVTDDGAPQPLSISWTQVTGPGVASFAAPTAATSAVTFSADGTYVLKITVTDGQFTVSDSVTVSVGASITPAQWIAQDLGPSVAQRGQTFGLNENYLLTGTGAGYASTASDAAHVMVRQVSGTSSIVARLTSVTGSAAAPLAGLTIRDSLSRGARRAVLGYVPGSGLQFRTRTTAGLTDTSAPQSAITLPVWLKLDFDSGTNTVTGSYAADAAGAPGAWNVVGSPIIVAMEGGAHLGLTCTSNSTGLANTAAFDQLTLTPAQSGSALVSEDFGTASPTGIVSENGGTVTIAANGSIDGSGTFYGRQYYGDLVVTAKLVDATSGAQSAKSGLMIRESMDTTAGYVLFGRIPQGAFNGYVWRTFAGGTGGGIPSFTNKLRWMRLLRKGNSVTAFHAADVSGAPGAWVQVGQPQTIIMSTPVLVGYAVDNSGGTGLNTAIFSNLTVVPLNQAPVVDAGNVTANPISPAHLVGSVSDDNYPAPPALVTQWLKVSGPASVNFDNAAAPVTNANFTADGAYTLRLTATDGSITTFEDLAFNAYTSAFGAWQGLHFSGGSSNPNAAPGFDADFDGLSNLLEYSLSTSPNAPNASPVISDTVTIGGNRFLRLTVPKNPAATDLTYSVQANNAMAQPLNWSATGLIIELNDGTTLRVRDNVPLGTATPPARFLRVFVTKP